MPQRLPLVPSVPSYSFRTELDGVTYFVRVRWNARDSSWYATLHDDQEVPILSGLRLVLGALPGIRSADPRAPGGVFLVTDLSNTGTEAGLDDMGERVVTSFFTDQELSG